MAGEDRVTERRGDELGLAKGATPESAQRRASAATAPAHGVQPSQFLREFIRAHVIRAAEPMTQ